MAIAFDAASNSSGVDQTGVNSLTFSHTVTGSNTILLVGASLRHDTGTGKTVTGVTFNGDAMTLVDQDTNNWGGQEYTSLWRLVNPDAGTHDIVVTYSDVCDYAIAGGVSYTGVDQTAPIGTATKANSDTGDPTVDVSSAAGELVVDSTIMDSPSTTVGAGQTERVNIQAGTPTLSQGMSEEAGAATVTMSWDQTQSDAWAVVAVPLKPAAAASTPSGTLLLTRVG